MNEEKEAENQLTCLDIFTFIGSTFVPWPHVFLLFIMHPFSDSQAIIICSPVGL